MKQIRCAIYTRKSSEEGLDQAFNSLHAQREACEAYIKSQIGEGWALYGRAYDDGGFSGGNMDRPALEALLTDIERGLVDVVVVYKVDRLTRSLTDFARIIEVLDRRGASFVSVTQAFNTTTSMGRLTLNVLLSFAQFEREVTSERIRDKIAASKAKGMWMGGNLPLGYDVRDRALVVNPTEAEQVRAIFNRYLDLGSVNALKAELDDAGARSKTWTTSSGSVRGGQPWSRGALFHVLKNPTYIGRVPHKGVSHPGLHEAILDSELFDRTQCLLTANAVERKARPTRVGASPLKGLIFDEAGTPMTPAFGRGKGGRAYRYYVSAAPKAAAAPSQVEIRRVSAPPIEALVRHRIERLGARMADRWQDFIRRVELRPQLVRLALDPARLIDCHEDLNRALVRLEAMLPAGDKLLHTDQGLLLVAPVRAVFRGGRTWLVGQQGGDATMRVRPDVPLIKALSRAHKALDQNRTHPSTMPADFTEARSPADSFQRILIPLAFLAPDIQLAIIEGRQPAGLTLEQLLRRKLPLAWTDQRTALGFPSL